jgi:hypothetical protein
VAFLSPEEAARTAAVYAQLKAAWQQALLLRRTTFAT